MFKQTYKKATSIRFRRWSRAKYAIFCSLSTAVTIGKVTVSIADKSLQKTAKICLNYFSNTGFEESSDEIRENDEIDTSLILTREIILTKTITDCAVACSLTSFYYIIHQAVETV